MKCPNDTPDSVTYISRFMSVPVLSLVSYKNGSGTREKSSETTCVRKSGGLHKGGKI